MSKRNIELMLDSLKSKTPILLVGAGFSLGATNKNGDYLPSSYKLAEDLYQYLIKLRDFDKNDLDLFSAHKNDLKYICTVFADDNLKKERDEYLVKTFSGCNCDENDYHMLLRKYDWKYIFTLNIDDLIEYIYSDKNIGVQVLSGGTSGKTADLQLIKLHGSASKPEYGFVFDNYEYDKMSPIDSWAHMQLGYEFVKNDVIILGTEFQESDILQIIDKFRDMSGVTSEYSYFFVSPCIKSRSLRKQIEQTRNMYHIEMNTEEFLQTIDKEITNVGETRRKMRDFGMVFLDEKKKEPIDTYYDAGLYHGESPRYQDFFGKWNIINPNVSRISKAASSSGSKLVTIYGNSFVGKSCAAMRMMVDLLEAGYTAVQFDITYSMDITKYKLLLIEYINSLPQGTCIAVLVENGASYYSAIRSIFCSHYTNIEKIILVITSGYADHKAKKYQLEGVDNWDSLFISEGITKKFATNIYVKLMENSHIGYIARYVDVENQNEVIKYLMEINDIVDVLYIAQRGRHFRQYFSSWISETRDRQNIVAFEYIVNMSKFGVYSMPVSLFSEIVRVLVGTFSFDSFASQYSNVIRSYKGEVYVRCMRILEDVLSGSIMKEALSYVVLTARVLAPKVSDREMSRNNELLQKILKVRNLLSIHNMTPQRINEAFNRVEEKCKHLSYYWVQKGIINRELTLFEEANNSFGQAALIRHYFSYQVKHAEAKNYMAWGIWERDECISEKYFEEGRKMLQELIESKQNGYFAYSVHTYIDMSIKYYEKVKRITGDEIEYMANKLLQLLKSHRDSYPLSVAKRYVETFRDMPNSKCGSIQSSMTDKMSEEYDIDLIEE